MEVGQGIKVPVVLDTNPAIEQFRSLTKEITTTELRPNKDLEDFFSGAAKSIGEAKEELSKFKMSMEALSKTQAPVISNVTNESQRELDRIIQKKKELNDLSKSAIGSLSYQAPFKMDMSALSGLSPVNVPPMERGPARSNEYQAMVDRYEKGKQSAYETGFQNRYLAAEISDGSLRKQIKSTLEAEKAAKRLQDRQTELIKQSRLMERQERMGRYRGSIVHAYLENKDAIQSGIGTAGRVAGVAGAAGVAMTVSGFSGTVEGERFAREMRVLSLEMAAAFKPLMDTITKGVRTFREKMQSMSQEEQDLIQRIGITAGGAYAGYKIGGPKGALVGAAVAHDVQSDSGMFSKMKTVYNEARYQFGYDTEERTAIRGRFKSMEGMSKEDKLKEIANQRESARSSMTGYGAELLTSPWEVTKNLAGFGSGKFSLQETQKRMLDYRRTMSELDDMQKKTENGESLDTSGSPGSKANPNRRQLMITEGTGFSSAGSTFFALQEDLNRTIAAELQKLNATNLEIANTQKAMAK